MKKSRIQEAVDDYCKKTAIGLIIAGVLVYEGLFPFNWLTGFLIALTNLVISVAEYHIVDHLRARRRVSSMMKEKRKDE